MKKKAAIELSANALVIILISIVILGLSIALTIKLMGKSNQMVWSIDENTQRGIEDLLRQPGARVALPVVQKDVSAGKFVRFDIGVKNVIGGGSPPINRFYAKIDFSGSAFDKNGNGGAACSSGAGGWIKYIAADFAPNPVTIENTAEKIFTVYFDAPKGTKSCTYIYNARICYNDGVATNNPSPFCSSPSTNNYPDSYIDGGMKKIYVVVK